MFSISSKGNARLVFTVLVLLWAMLQQQIALACATCGCSEVCPLVMLDESAESSKTKGLLTESIWGNIILKMAYQRDPVIRKLLGLQKDVDFVTSTAYTSAVGGTLAQNVVSQATLNPPAGQMDSYLPGSLGLGFSALVNVALDGSLVLKWHTRKKIRARQAEVRAKVEAILEHLEYSIAECPEAQKDLTGIIGERASKECIQLWQSSHEIASEPDNTNAAKQSLNEPQPTEKQMVADGQPLVERQLTMAKP